MLTPARIAVLVSGGGTNLQALLDAQRDGKMPHGEIVLVVSSRAGAYALTRARKAKVPCVAHLSPRDFSSREKFDEACAALLKEQGVELVVLAGFMRILSEVMVSAYPNAGGNSFINP